MLFVFEVYALLDFGAHPFIFSSINFPGFLEHIARNACRIGREIGKIQPPYLGSVAAYQAELSEG